MEKHAKKQKQSPFLVGLIICIFFFAYSSSFKFLLQFLLGSHCSAALKQQQGGTVRKFASTSKPLCIKKKLFLRTVMQHLQPFTIQKTHLSRSGARRCKKVWWESGLKCSFVSAAPKVREPRGRGRRFDEESFFFFLEYI